MFSHVLIHYNIYTGTLTMCGVNIMWLYMHLRTHLCGINFTKKVEIFVGVCKFGVRWKIFHRNIIYECYSEFTILRI